MRGIPSSFHIDFLNRQIFEMMFHLRIFSRLMIQDRLYGGRFPGANPQFRAAWTPRVTASNICGELTIESGTTLFVRLLVTVVTL